MSGKPPESPEELEIEKQISHLNLELAKAKSADQVHQIRDKIFLAEEARWVTLHRAPGNPNHGKPFRWNAYVRVSPQTNLCLSTSWRNRIPIVWQLVETLLASCRLLIGRASKAQSSPI